MGEGRAEEGASYGDSIVVGWSEIFLSQNIYQEGRRRTAAAVI